MDGSLYAKVRKKESLEGAVTSNGLPSTTAEHALPTVDHALSVSSDSGNSTASIKTDRTDEAALQVSTVSQTHIPVGEELPSVHHPPTPVQQPISPQEKKELEQLLSGLEGPMNRQAYLSTPASAPGGMLHLVPAQVHVNGNTSIDRETDILDDELPTTQEGNSVDSLGTFSSTDGRATPADMYFQSEPVINGQDHVPYLERSVPEKPMDFTQSKVLKSDKSTSLNQNNSSPANYMALQNGSLYRSHSFGTDLKSMPQAPARTTSSREAVQRGLNIWHQFGIPEEPLTEGLTFSPPPPVGMSSHHSLPQFPHRHSASQQEIEQSIETLNLLMLDLEPGRSAVTKSQSAPLRENSFVVTTQPSFSQNQARPSYPVEAAVHTLAGGPTSLGSHSPSAQISQAKPSTPEPAPVHRPLTSETVGATFSSQVFPSISVSLQQKSVSTFPPSTQLRSSEVSEPQRILTSDSTSPQLRESEPDEVCNVEGLVAQRVAGKIKRSLVSTLYFVKPALCKSFGINVSTYVRQ